MNEALDDCWNSKGVRGDRSCELLSVHTHCRNCDRHGLAAGRIMQRELPEDYRREWAEHFARDEQARRHADLAAMVFRIGPEWLALPAYTAVTVADHASAHKLPHRSGTILTGIVSIRGRLYPCMSLAGLLEIGEGAPSAPLRRRIYPRLLAVRLQQQVYALPVDELHGIHRHGTADVRERPAAANPSLYRYINGILHIDDRVVGCLDAELLGVKLAGLLR